jgi:hypothetical protein
MKQNSTFPGKAIAALILFTILHLTSNAQVKQLYAQQGSALTAIVNSNGMVTINWASSSANNDLVIERSFDQADFKAICYVMAVDKSEVSDAFCHFNDRSAELVGKTRAFYRIRQTDRNGVVSYSDLLPVVLKSGYPDNR